MAPVRHRSDAAAPVPDDRRRPAGRRARALAYCLPALVAFAVVASWFDAGRFWATGDMAPFERRSSVAEAFSIWSHQLTGAGGPSYDVVRAPELAFVVAGESLGLGAATAQRFFFAAVAALAVAAAVYFAFSFVASPIVAGAAGLLAFFNVFVLQRLPNALTPWSIMVMALVGGVILRSARVTRAEAPASVSRPLLLGLCSVTASYLALNPPLLVASALWAGFVVVACGVLWGRAALSRAAGLVGRAAPWAAVLNLWWLVPFVVTLLGARSSFGAETSVTGWSWTHARNSLANVVTLSGVWAWDIPDFFPYAARLDSPPWAALRFALPLLAASALLLARRARRQVAGLLALAVPLVLLSKGLHPPFGDLNRLLYDHVPAMYLFREPLGKFGPMLLLVLVALCALALQGALERPGAGAAARIVPVGAVAAALAYPLPLWSGEVVTGRRGVLPSSSVSVPEAWRDVAQFLNGSTRPGKVLVLPLDDFYMMPTTWGFYGADVIPRFLLRRATVQPLAESYIGDPPGFKTLVARAEQALLAGDTGDVPGLLDALGVADVVVRKDIDRRFPGRSLPDPALLERELDRVPGLEKALSNEVADVWSLPADRATVQLAKASVGAPEDDIAAVLGASSAGTVTRPLGGGRRRAYVLEAPERALEVVSDGGPYVLDRQLVTGLSVELGPSVEHPGALEVRDAAPVEVDGTPVVQLPPGLLPLPPSGQWAATAAGRVLSFEEGRAEAIVRPGGGVAVFDTGAATASGGGFSDAGDCHARDDRTAEEVGIRGERLGGDLPGIRLEAREHIACSVIELPEPPTGGPSIYRVRMEYRTESGRRARMCLYRLRTGRCDPLAPLGESSSWEAFDEVVVAEADGGGARLFVYADGDAPDGATTVTEYRNVAATAHPAHSTWTVPAVRPARVELPPGPHVVHLGGKEPRRVELEPGEVGDCHAHDARLPSAVGIESAPIDQPPPAVRLRAREHIGCVVIPVGGPSPEARQRVSLGYRAVEGRPPRICLYQVGPDRCAALPPLESGDGWRSLDHTVVPERGTRELRLVLYADGAGSATTTVEYRDVRVETVAPFDVIFAPASADEGSPALAWRRNGSASYTIEVPASSSPRTVVLAESYSPSWTARTTPAVSVEHFRANGYANAWELPPGPSVTLAVAYRPNEVFVAAMALSAAAVLVGARSAIRRPGRCRAPMRARRRAAHRRRRWRARTR